MKHPEPLTIDDIPSFNTSAVVERMDKRWGWLGKDAAKALLDSIAPDIRQAIDNATAPA